MDEEKKEIVEVEKIENTENKENTENIENIKNTNNNTEKAETKKKERKGFCIASLILGIVTLIFFFIWFISIPCGILAIIFGILGIKTTNKSMAIAGLITGSIGLIISFLIVALLLVFQISLVK